MLNANHIAGVFPGDTPTIETELRRLGSLVQLSLSDNNLTVITPAIACLGTLEYLQLENNMISSLPPSIGFLRRLTRYVRYRSHTIDDGSYARARSGARS